MHNQLKNHFGTEFLKKEIFDGTHIAKKGKNLQFIYATQKSIWNHFSKNEILMGPTLPKLGNTPKQTIFSVC